LCQDIQSQSFLTIDSQSASLSWYQATIRAFDQFSFLLEIFLRQLRVCYFMAPPLPRGRVCNLLLLLGSSAQSFSDLCPAELNTLFYCPKFETLQPGSYLFISARNRMAQLLARALRSLFVASYVLQGCVVLQEASLCRRGGLLWHGFPCANISGG
jgi:hypothetical protein